jgi:hypothetical protein
MIASTFAVVLSVACGGGQGLQSLRPPPEASWSAAVAGFALGGTSFVGTYPTSADLRLTFFVHSASRAASLSSTDGGCQVTVAQAEATAFVGTFSCAGIADANGTLVVDAQGSFAATG